MKDNIININEEIGTNPFAPVEPDFGKLFKSMRYFLLGLLEAASLPGMPEKQRDELLRYRIALDALEYAAKIHCGIRKNGRTPEFQHQLEIAHLLRTKLRYLRFPAETLAAVFLHDTPEDYDVKHGELEQRFGKIVADAAVLLNKYDEEGQQKPLDAYYTALGHCPICSVVKPGDNCQNVSSMSDVFSFKKQYEYSMNIKTRSWAMMKDARRRFSDQEPVYESLKFIMRIQYNAVMAALNALQFDIATGEIHPALS